MRRLAWGLLGATAVCGLMVGGAWIYARMSLPQTSGTVVVKGPITPIEIRRDRYGIPTIISANEHDGYFALGYVHAQDRLFQMELMRRLAQGRLAEILGANALSSDRFMRTLGLSQLTNDSYSALNAKTKRALKAYADGVNAAIGEREHLPPEFALLGINMQPWEPAHSLLWARLMGLRLSGNLWQEALGADLSQRLPPLALDDLWPRTSAVGSGNTTTIPAALAPQANQSPPSANAQSLPQSPPLGAAPLALLDQWPAVIAPSLASNAWAVGGEHSASGKPLLANDPHLNLQIPSQWYLAELRLPERTIAGATAPGVPFHIIGYNDKIAWGFTTTHSDSMDLFIEKLADPEHYLTAQGSSPLLSRQETIIVRGGEPQTLTVRSTHHGPLISDLLPASVSQGHPLALAATALQADDHSADAFYGLGHAANVGTAIDALRALGAPQQNTVIADDQGGMMFVVPARAPIRGAGDSSLPVPGWTGAYDWQGWQPASVMPLWKATAQDTIVSANNQPISGPSADLLAASWPPPYRAQRITALLEESNALTQEQMGQIQRDIHSPLAAPFIAHLNRVATAFAKEHSLTGKQKQALDMLTSWDGAMRANRPEPLLFSAWLLQLQQDIFSPTLGDAYDRWGGLHAQAMLTVLQRGADQAQGYAWCGASPQDCDSKLLTALSTVIASLSEEFGDEMEEWQWGDAHRARLSHPLFGHIPLLKSLSDRSFSADGGAETINRANFAGGSPSLPWQDRLADVHGPSLRMTIDLSNHHQAETMLAGGQSGHPFSPHYDDLLDLWLADQGVTISQSPAEETLFLEPER